MASTTDIRYRDSGIAEDWQENAACKGRDDLDFFPPRGGGSVGTALKTVCINECPVRDECLEYALWSGEKHGIWGGVSESGRRRIRRDRRAAGLPVGGRESYRQWDIFTELR